MLSCGCVASGQNKKYVPLKFEKLSRIQTSSVVTWYVACVRVRPFASVALQQRLSAADQYCCCCVGSTSKELSSFPSVVLSLVKAYLLAVLKM
jgi:hypothetical protein